METPTVWPDLITRSRADLERQTPGKAHRRLTTSGSGFARSILATALLAALVGCSSGGGGGGSGGDLDDDVENPDFVEAPKVGIEGSYLFLSGPDLYFGTREVGSRTRQDVVLANRGGDRYPIRDLTIVGESDDEFGTDYVEDFVLEPADAVRIPVTFNPVSEGRKLANLTFDFDTIVQVTERDNRNEQRYYRARDLEDTRDYDASVAEYGRYLDGGAVTKNKQRAAIKIPVIEDSRAYGSDEQFAAYLDALDARNAGDHDIALRIVDRLLVEAPDHRLADDALYLKGYMQLMDLERPAAAGTTLARLLERYPDTSYADSALYARGIASRETGEFDAARAQFQQLLDRHTARTTFGVPWPRDNVVSRLWFDRAEDGLETLENV